MVDCRQPAGRPPKGTHRSAAGTLLVATFPPSRSCSPAPAAAGAGSRARATSAAPASKADAGSDSTPAYTPPPELEGCAQSLPVHAARTAAAARKKQGYPHGLHQALLLRDRCSNSKTAAAAAACGAYGRRAELAPLALPSCLLHLDLMTNTASAAAAAAATGGCDAAAAAGGGISGGGSAPIRDQRSLRGKAARVGSSSAAEAVGTMSAACMGLGQRWLLGTKSGWAWQ